MFTIPQDANLTPLTGLHPFTALDLLTLVELDRIREAVIEAVGQEQFDLWKGQGIMFFDKTKRLKPDTAPLDFVVEVYAMSRRRGELEAFIMAAIGREWLASFQGASG